MDYPKYPKKTVIHYVLEESQFFDLCLNLKKITDKSYEYILLATSEKDPFDEIGDKIDAYFESNSKHRIITDPKEIEIIKTLYFKGVNND